VKGIEIRVHLLFALVLVWAALDWGVWRGLGLAGALYGVVFVALLFTCVTLHELGHSLVARAFGLNVRDITLLPIGGLARLDGELKRPRQEFWMALAGPAVNLGLAALLVPTLIPLVGWRALGGLSSVVARFAAPGAERLLVDLMAANLGLALFNLLPAFPMDGGRVLRAVLASRIGELDGTRIATRVGQGLAVVLGLAGLFTGAWNLALISVFIFASAGQEWQAAQLKLTLREMPASAALMRGGVLLSPHESLSRAIDVTLRGAQGDFAVFDRGYLVGILARQDVAGAFERYGPTVLVGRVMRTDFPVARSNETLFDLERKMRTSGSSAVSVVEEGRFLGLVTREGIRAALRHWSARGWRPGRA
jgi:Zn-dependent protease/CBS domain-containing protein